MTRYVVDTNVPVVANGSAAERHAPSLPCRKAAVKFLLDALDEAEIFLDLAGEIQGEYHTYLNPHGQPGVGDRFYLEILNSAPGKVTRVELPKGDDGEFVDMPRALIEANFDPSDRKFAALAKKIGALVVNAVDSDWVQHAAALAENSINVMNICGCNPEAWYD